MILSPNMKMAGVAAGCATVGAVVGIAGAAAAPSSHATTAAATASGHRFHRGFGLGFPGARRMGLGPAVHVAATVLDRAGTGFITVTEDAGHVESVSGDQLTVKEAVGNVVDRTVTLTVPSGATVRRDGVVAQLSALRPGDRVHVVQSSEGSYVMAADASFTPRREGFGRWRSGGPASTQGGFGTSTTSPSA